MNEEIPEEIKSRVKIVKTMIPCWTVVMDGASQGDYLEEGAARAGKRVAERRLAERLKD